MVRKRNFLSYGESLDVHVSFQGCKVSGRILSPLCPSANLLVVLHSSEVWEFQLYHPLWSGFVAAQLQTRFGSVESACESAWKVYPKGQWHEICLSLNIS